MKVLITGSAGMLGRAVVAALSVDHEVTGVDLPDGDLTKAGDVKRIFESANPQWVVHCAAWTDVDGAETAAEQAYTANCTATGNLVTCCEETGCGITYVSTDYVFNGIGNNGGYDESDFRDPVNRYGYTKACGEEVVEAAGVVGQIVRTSWLFGDGKANFPKTIRRLLSQRDQLQVVDDQIGCPTYAEDLAEIIGFLVSNGQGGIFHGTNFGSCTWYELAQEVAKCTGDDPGRIKPCPSSAYPTPAVRPVCSVLRSSNLEKLGLAVRPTWQDALFRYLRLLDSGSVIFP